MTTQLKKVDRPPSSLGAPGMELYRWIEQHYDTEGTAPLIRELCTLADRLAEIRAALKNGLDARLVNAEVKVASQFTKTWRLLGLADDDMKKKGQSGRLQVR